MTIVEMRTFLVEHIAGFDPASSDAAVAAAYADYLDDAAALEPLTLAEVKTNLRVDPDSTAEDDLISALIVSAREHVENATGLVLTPRLVTETVDQLGRWIDLASWPVTSVEQVRYPLAGVMTPLPVGSWQTSITRRPVRIIPAMVGWGIAAYWGAAGRMPGGVWFAQLPIEVDVQAGYATPDDVPRAVRQAMHLLVAHFYGNRAAAEVGARAAAIEIPFGVTELLRPYRVVRV